jgi:hypothetical protein
MAVFERGHPERKLHGQLLWFGVWLVVTLIGALVLTPSAAGHGTHQQLGLPPCPTVMLFDRPCPGCGLTTSWTALLHGRVGESLRAHPLGPPLYAIFSLSALFALFGWWTGRRARTEDRWFNWGVSGVVICLVVFGIVRASVTPAYATPAERAIIGLIR